MACLRKKVENADLPNSFFPNASGSALNSSSFTYGMQKLRNEAGLDSEVDPTLIRKSSVTIVHQFDPSRSADLAAKTNHSETSANKSYFTIDGAIKSKEVSKELRSIVSGSSVSQQHLAVCGSSWSMLDNTKSDELTSELHSSLHSTSEQLDSSEISAEEIQESMFAEQESSTENQDSENMRVHKKSSLCPNNHFSPAEEDVLKELFMLDLKANKIMPLEYIQSRLLRNAGGRMLMKKFTLYKIKNKLNFYKRKLRH